MSRGGQTSAQELFSINPSPPGVSGAVLKQAQVKPRPVFCVIAHAYRDRGLAEAVCKGRFTHAGVTLDISDRPDWPDWLTADLPADEEWRIEWSKFYYGIDLASAFRETGDIKFLGVWERLVRSWIRQVPIGADPSDVTGRRIQNWIYAWNAFSSAPGFPGLTQGLDEEIIASITQQVRHLQRHLTPERNHRTLELHALFVTALALPEVDPDASLLKFATQELHLNLLTDIRPDGVHRENSTHYHMVVLRSFLAARENARRFGLTFPDSYDERLTSACEFALHCHRPDGLIPMLSDSDTNSYADLLELAASLLDRPDFLYAATAGARGTAPQQRYVSFPEGGYYIQRSGWGNGKDAFRQERFLIFDCGPLGDGGHGHYDLLNVEIAAGGRPLVVDPGRYTYSEQPPNWRRWFKGTAAHNTVCIDDTDQTPYRSGKPKGPVAQGRLIEHVSAPGFDLLCGEARSPSYEVVHTRRIFFIADEYWIIVDQLRGARPHRFDLRFHLAAEAWNRTTLFSSENNEAVHAPGHIMVFGYPNKPSIQQGWVAPKYGLKLPAPVISVVKDDVVKADFFTLVVPLDLADQTPTLRIQRTEASETMMIEVSGVGSNTKDQVVWNAGGETIELGPFKFRASAAWLRTAAEDVVAFRACDVEQLTQVSNGRVETSANVCHSRWISWDKKHGMTYDTGRRL